MLTCIFGYMALKTILTYKSASNEYSLLKNNVLKPAKLESIYLDVDFDSLVNQNPDVMAWIEIPNTNVSYPVMFAADYEEYIHTTFDGSYNPSGSIFADYRCNRDFSSKNTILYGHNMKDGSMFADISDYLDEDKFLANKEIRIYMKGEVLLYEVFSAFQTEASDENYNVSFSDNDYFYSWVKRVASYSWYYTEVELRPEDRVLMLSTCKGGENNTRTVVFARLSKIVELK